MREFVLGTGNRQSLREVVSLMEEQITRSHGIPRRIEATSERMELVVERAEYQGAFTHYSIRVHASQKRAVSLKETLQKHLEVCSLRVEDGMMVIQCPTVGQTPPANQAEIIDIISNGIRMPEVWRVKGDNFRLDPVRTELLFQAMIQYKASDVHLSPGLNPVFRIDNQTRSSDFMGAVSAPQIEALIQEIAPREAWEEFEREKQTSFNFHQSGLGYARVSAFIKSGAPHCTFRYLPEVVPSFEELHIPSETMVKLAELHRGLLLVTGMTGSGKTTTVAALVDWINAHRQAHILTIENPIEYVHQNKKSIISQRNLGPDVDSFHNAVTGALRHDPDVILIGEMRDPDTIRSAINAAATGHLVISTLHANTASEVVNRIISFFDPIERDLVKLQLSDCLQCIICQRLVPKIGGGRVPALEILLKDVKPITDGIKEGDTDLIRIGMQQSVSHSMLFEKYLFDLYKAGVIEIEQGREFSTDQSLFDQLQMGTYSIPRLDAIKGKDHDSTS